MRIGAVTLGLCLGLGLLAPAVARAQGGAAGSVVGPG
jgi:hypothetical protein